MFFRIPEPFQPFMLGQASITAPILPSAVSAYSQPPESLVCCGLPHLRTFYHIPLFQDDPGGPEAGK